MWVGQGDGFPAAVTSTWIPLDPRVCTETQAHSTSAPGPYANQALLIHRGTQNTLTTCQDGHSQEIENKRQNHGAHTHTFTSDMFTHLTQGCAWTCSQPLHPPAHRSTLTTRWQVSIHVITCTPHTCTPWACSYMHVYLWGQRHDIQSHNSPPTCFSEELPLGGSQFSHLHNGWDPGPPHRLTWTS